MKVDGKIVRDADFEFLGKVHRLIEGDTFFPPIDPTVWQETAREDRGEISFVTYIRTK